MSDFEKLKNMDMQEIHKKTRITAEKLNYLLQKDFDKLESPTTTRGFIRILERELKLDLSEILNEYHDYLAHKEIEERKKLESMQQADSKKAESNERIVISATVEQGSTTSNPQLKWIGIGVVIAVIIIALIYIVASNDSKQSSQVQQEPQEQINKIELKEDTEQPQSNQTESQIKVEEPKQIEAKQVEPKPNENYIGTGTLTITPKSAVWFSYKDIVSKKSGDKYTTTPYNMEIENSTIFHFGNGLVTLEINGRKFNYNQMDITYMVYTPESGFKIITKAEYSRLAK